MEWDFRKSIKANELYTPISVAKQFLSDRKPFYILSESAMSSLPPECEVNLADAVCIGLCPEKFDYEHMQRAFSVLKKENTLFLAMNKSRYFGSENGNQLGSGAFVSGLEFSTGKAATVLGKPSIDFFLASIKDAGLRPEEVVMVGDDALDDVNGAMKAGINGILVKTGKYSKGYENQCPGAFYVADDFRDAITFLRENNHI